MSQPSAVNVSNYFVNRAIDEEKPITIMAALKLTYIAQGFHLALEGEPFFSEEIRALQYGPVIYEVYDHLKDAVSSEHIVKDRQEPLNFSFSERQEDILGVVFKKYSKLDAWSLSRLTHRKGTPWSEIFHGDGEECGSRSVIPTNMIKEHFCEIVTPESFVILLSKE